MSDTPSHNSVFRPRKRVVAREVTAEVEATNRQSAEIEPADLLGAVDPDAPAGEAFRADAITIIDPSLLGGRRRRTSHHRLYRWTQICTMLSALSAGASVLCTMVAEIPAAWSCGFPAVALALVATVLAGQSSLSARWRGWAIAALVFSVTAVALTWVEPAITRDDAPLQRPRSGT